MDYYPAWSNDGKRIYFSSFREGTHTLWLIERDGGAPERLMMGTGGENRPTISRDGSRFAYAARVTNCNLFIRDTRTGVDTKIRGMRDDWMAAMAPDGDRIVISSDRMGSKNDLWLVQLEDGIPAGTPERLTDTPGNSSHPVFSGDGEWLAYYRIIGEERDIWTLPATGGRPTRFTDNEAEDIHPAWSPDGTQLAFISNRDGLSRVWAADVSDGRRVSEPRPITSAEVNAYAPMWSPDGESIAFIGMQGNALEVWVVDADGDSPARQITNGANALRVRWDRSTGTILASGTWGGDRYTLREIDPAGGEPAAPDKPIVFGANPARAGFDLSSDGRFIVFCQEEISGNIWILESKSGTY
jgi:TolB protein